jgi:ectoine hydroxylase-related dioxygenase (phytanoyl-CoA dioxygenase family)
VDWSLSDWINVQRPLAKENVTEEVRVHPVPLEDISTSSEIRIAGNTGEILIFSGSHLHGTVANYTEQTRFSIDFRLVHIVDLLHGRGAVNVDSAVQDAEAGYKDFFHVSDFSHFQGVNQ